MDLLKVASYNCKNFNNIVTQSYIQKAFKECNILLLQEHWLLESQFSLLYKSVDVCDVAFIAKSSMDQSVLLNGRPFGGSAIIWKTTMTNKVVPVETISNRLTCIKCFLDEENFILIFNVYMPCDSGRKDTKFLEYQDILSEMQSIYVDSDAMYCIIGGDWNTDLSRSNSHFVHEFKSFCNSLDFVSCSQLPISSITYTFECAATHNRSHIDHFVVSNNLRGHIMKYYDVDSIDNRSDHLGIILELEQQIDHIPMSRKKYTPKTAWYKATIEDIDLYKEQLDIELNKIRLPDSCINCHNFTCEKHMNDIETFHNDIVCACLKAAECLPTTNNSNKTSVPGWSEYCATAREKAMFWHNIWRNAGKPHSGQLANLRRSTRAHYHRAVRKVKRNESIIRSEQMAKFIHKNDMRNLFKEARRLKCSGSMVPASVDGTSGNENIANLFASKFQNVFNSVKSEDKELNKLKCYINNQVSLSTREDKSYCLLDFSDMSFLISNLKNGKYDGNLGLFSDHIIHGSEMLFTYLTLLFNCMLVHGSSPVDMSISTMVPIPKGKQNISLSDNFIGICLQSILCKILDIHILNKQRHKLYTSELQFGFKESHSAAMATTIVTETIDYYLNNDGIVHGLALDATKAFDRVNYVALFNMILSRKCNIFFVRILLNMYVNQKIRVRFNGALSNLFHQGNGVKQGGILSPTLFICYIDGLLHELQEAKIGCYVGSIYTGCVSYADDIILLAPNLAALRHMVTICENYAVAHSILFNGKKCKLITFQNVKDNRAANVGFDIYVSDQKVEVVDKILYLGHVLEADRSKSLIEHVRKDFVKQSNAFLKDFKHISSPVQHNLFQKYCYSFYGLCICDFESNDFMQLCTEWRKILRRVWKLPYRTHCNLLPHIAKCIPPDVFLMQRFVSFFYNGLYCSNSTVATLFHAAITSYSRLGRNIRFIIGNLGLYVSEIANYNPMYIRTALLQKWASQIHEPDIKTGHQISELVSQRDNLNKWFLTRKECKILIDLLCVE